MRHRQVSRQGQGDLLVLPPGDDDDGDENVDAILGDGDDDTQQICKPKMHLRYKVDFSLEGNISGRCPNKG